jgi:hypothetical protein
VSTRQTREKRAVADQPSYNTDEKANAVGRETPSPYNPIGPTITSVIDCREGNDNPLDGFVIEEGAIPHALSHFFQAMLDLMPGKKEPKNETLMEKTQAALARYGSRFLGPYFKNGAVERTQIYLVMSHDSKIPKAWLLKLRETNIRRQPSRADPQGRQAHA